MPPKPSPLLRLPRELRDIIYYYAVHDDPDVQGSSDSKTVRVGRFHSEVFKPTSYLPAICHVNRQLYYEAAPEFIKSREFILRDRFGSELMLDWLHSIPNGMRSVQAVKFRSFTRCHPTLELLRRCQYLTSIHINFNGGKNLKYMIELPTNDDVEAEILWLLGAKELLKLKYLKSLTFDCRDVGQRYLGREDQWIVEFASRVLEGFFHPLKVRVGNGHE